MSLNTSCNITWNVKDEDWRGLFLTPKHKKYQIDINSGSSFFNRPTWYSFAFALFNNGGWNSALLNTNDENFLVLATIKKALADFINDILPEVLITITRVGEMSFYKSFGEKIAIETNGEYTFNGFSHKSDYFFILFKKDKINKEEQELIKEELSPITI